MQTVALVCAPTVPTAIGVLVMSDAILQHVPVLAIYSYTCADVAHQPSATVIACMARGPGLI